jgi:hypothetical protein
VAVQHADVFEEAVQLKTLQMVLTILQVQPLPLDRTVRECERGKERRRDMRSARESETEFIMRGYDS